MYLEAVSGRLMALKSRSDTARLMTKAVVACTLSLAHRSRATTVSRLPVQTTVAERSQFLQQSELSRAKVSDSVNCSV